MKIKKITLHTPQESLEITLLETEARQDDLDKLIDEWGKVLIGEIDNIKLNYFTFGVKGKFAKKRLVVLPRGVLEKSFVTVDYE